MDSFEKFFEKQLPARYKFYSSLENECISKMLIMFGICLE